MRRGSVESKCQKATTPFSSASSNTASGLAGRAGRLLKSTECNAAQHGFPLAVFAPDWIGSRRWTEFASQWVMRLDFRYSLVGEGDLVPDAPSPLIHDGL